MGLRNTLRCVGGAHIAERRAVAAAVRRPGIFLRPLGPPPAGRPPVGGGLKKKPDDAAQQKGVTLTTIRELGCVVLSPTGLPGIAECVSELNASGFLTQFSGHNYSDKYLTLNMIGFSVFLAKCNSFFPPALRPASEPPMDYHRVDTWTLDAEAKGRWLAALKQTRVCLASMLRGHSGREKSGGNKFVWVVLRGCFHF